MGKSDILSRIIDELRQYFPDYLKSRGLIVKGRSFQCPNFMNHKHGDKTPSAYMFPDRTAGKCFVCDKVWDIFSASEVLDGGSIEGKGFIEIVKRLAGEFLGYTEEDFKEILQNTSDTDYDEAPTHKKKYILYELLNKILYILDKVTNERASEILAERGLTDKKKNLDLGIYAIGDEKYFNNLFKKVFTEKEQQILYEYFSGEDIFHTIFSQDNIIFVSFDEGNHPLGFAARRPNGVKPKYINNPNFDNIFKKGNLLYGYQVASIEKHKDTLYIVEGYIDVASLYYIGLPAVSVMGTSITSKQIELIRRLDYQRIVVMLDNDEAGLKGSNKVIEKLYKSDVRAHLYLFNWSKVKKSTEIKDPDDLIQRLRDKPAAIEKFKKISYSYDYYQFKIDQYGLTRDNIVEKSHDLNVLLDEIASYEPLEQVRWSKYISELTGLPVEEVHEDLYKRHSRVLLERDERIRQVADDLSRDISKFRTLGQPIAQSIISAAEKVERIMDDYFEKIGAHIGIGVESFEKFLENIKASDEKRYASLSWEKFSNVQYHGVALESVLTIIGGDAHAGKSSLMRNLAINIVMNNIGNNITVLYHSNDDSKERVYMNLLAILSGVPIYDIRHWNKLLKSRSQYAVEAIERLNVAEERLKSFLGSALIVTDIRDGNTITFLSKMLERIYDTGNIPILFIDSLHKLEEETFEGRSAVEHTSFIARKAKELSVKYQIPVFTISELRKKSMSTKAEKYYLDHSNLAGSRSLLYEPDITMMIRNDYITNRDNYDPNMVWREDDKFILKSRAIKMIGDINPIIVVTITKNKFSGYDRPIVMKLRRTTTEIFEYNEIEEEIEKSIEKVEDNDILETMDSDSVDDIEFPEV